MDLCWGVKDLDRSRVKAWDADYTGELIWDDTLTVTPVENQQALLQLCEDLRRTDNDLVKGSYVNCWISDLDQFIRA